MPIAKTRSQHAILEEIIETIGKHIANDLLEELAGLSVVAKFATVQNESGKMDKTSVESIMNEME